eukprot:TRINITY_DN2768_c3_g1_i7.p1 TRINITY_DN2768_c3_g1~~TRINITY_DN2768_c3_g1_i7.p1  ORF type:complete len:349 (+),score=188.44 TRINITY_DN2768_c3_g1_i7:171-1217(+)
MAVDKESTKEKNPKEEKKKESTEEDYLPRGTSIKESKEDALPTKKRKEIVQIENLFGGEEVKKKAQVEKENRIKERKKQKEQKEKGEEDDEEDDGVDDNIQDEDEREVNQFIRMQTKAPEKAKRLDYFSLSTGTILLCSVHQINDLGMVLSLPFGQKGYVNITEVSDSLSRILEKSAKDEDISIPSLSEFFKEGQIVRAIIVKLGTAEDKRVDLSLKSSRLNEKLRFDSIRVGVQIDAHIKSVEEKGYTVSTGIENSKAFLNFDDAKNSEQKKLKVGQPIYAAVKDIKESTKMIFLTLDPKKTNARIKSDQVLNLSTLRPGMLVKTKVNTILENGLFVLFMDYFAGVF